MIFTKDALGNKHSKALMGPIPVADYIGSQGSNAPSHGMPRFRNASFDAAYPFATVNLRDDEMPVTVKVKPSTLHPGRCDRKVVYPSPLYGTRLRTQPVKRLPRP